MTNSAKQGTAKAEAKAAGTEPAEQESPQAEASPATEAAAEPETGPEAVPGQPDLDETKRKFREALERKNQGHNEGQGNTGRDGSKVSNAHGPAASRRNFRRKSG